VWVAEFETFRLEKHPSAGAEYLAEFKAACLPGVAEISDNGLSCGEEVAADLVKSAGFWMG
jgi:hypothetical protein